MVPERCLVVGVADRAVASKTLLEHPEEKRDLTIDVVIDSDLCFPRV
jgi:hypothetical protein